MWYSLSLPTAKCKMLELQHDLTRQKVKRKRVNRTKCIVVAVINSASFTILAYVLLRTFIRL
jgi:hypothetical protein